MRATTGLSTTRWRKSSYSNPDGGNCVEVADGLPVTVPVRDSKNTTGPVLMVRHRAWNRFVHGLKSGAL